MSARSGPVPKFVALVASFAIAGLCAAPFGAANFYSMLADHLCTCDETPVGDAAGFVCFSLPATVASLLLGTIVCWPARRLLSARLAAIVAGGTLGALPYAAMAFLGIYGLADSGFPDWSVFVLAYLVGALIGAAVWLTLSLGGPWRGRSETARASVSAVFE